jgi:hypothetical protein
MSHRRSLARQFCEDSSSEDEELMMVAIIADEEQARLDAPRHRGSLPGRQSLQRDFAERFQCLYKDYFAENCTFNARMFRRRYVTSVRDVFGILVTLHVSFKFLVAGIECTVLFFSQ